MKHFFFALFFCLQGLVSFAGNIKDDAGSVQQAKQLLQNLSVKFLENKGQMTDMEGRAVPFVLFKAEAPGVNLYITEQGLTIQTLKMNETIDDDNEKTLPCYSTAWERIDLVLKGANIRKENIIKEGVGKADLNFFYPHCSAGIYAVKEYEKITIKNIYPGIDWVFYNSSSNGFKYDFIVNPGADHKLIELLYKSKNPLKINSIGELELVSAYGNITEHNPISFFNGQKIETHFRQNYQKQMEINGDKGFESSVSFSLEAPLANGSGSSLIIDPQLTWATVFGGNNTENAHSATTDGNGNLYITGYTQSTNFPVLNPGGGAYFLGTSSGSNDALVMKFSNTGVLLWATYYGGTGIDFGRYITADANGNIFIVGQSSSTVLPLVNPGSGAYFQTTNTGGTTDFILLKFSSANSALLWATFFGGEGFEMGTSMAIDASGNIFVTGLTNSNLFPVFNPGGGAYYQGTYGSGTADACVLKFSNSGVRLWATYFGGWGDDEGNAITVDASGNIFLAGYTDNAGAFPLLDPGNGAYYSATALGGQEAFIAKFDPQGTLFWSTYYGGSGFDWFTSMLIDVNGDLVVMGWTNSSGLPTVNPGGGAYFQGAIGGSNDLLLFKFSTSTCAMLWGTYFGGSGVDRHNTYDNLAVDACGNLYMGFSTQGGTCPILSSCDAGFNDNVHGGGTRDLGLAMFSSTGKQLWTTYIGGDGLDLNEALAVDGNDLYMAGKWTNAISNSSYPFTDPGGGAYFDSTFSAGQDDGYILKFTPSPIVTSFVATAPICSNPCGGSVTINSPSTCLSYSWSNGQTTQTATGLCVGNYTVTLTNVFCVDTTITVTVPPIIGGPTASASISSTILCNGGATGSATASATGGTSPYTYSWSNSQTNAIATGLIAGTYTVTVTDAGGCTSTQTVTITQPVILSATISNVNVSCNGGNNASSTLTVNGGTSPYTYSWSNSQTSATATGLIAGTFTVSITDANGCTDTQIVTITEPAVISASATAANTTCGNSNGSVSVAASGGIGILNYSWAPTGNTNSSVSGLAPGSYTVYITDANGCTQSDTVSVIASSSPNLALQSQTNVFCSGGTSGSATMVSSGGNGPYTFLWSPSGGTNSIATGLGAGNYTCTVTDANGCTATQTVVISQGSAITINTSSTPATCIGNNGSASANASGGTSPYTYLWNDGQTTVTATGLAAGNYTVTITDVNGCTQTQTISVTQTSGPTAAINASSTQLFLGENSQLTATGGVTYLWSPANGLSCTTCSNPVVTPTQTTTYCVLVTDANGCTDNICITISVETPCILQSLETLLPNAFSPNNNGNNDMYCVPNNACIKSFVLKVYDRWGERVFLSDDLNKCWDGTYRDISLNTDVFVYYFDAVLSDGTSFSQKGNISLIR